MATISFVLNRANSDFQLQAVEKSRHASPVFKLSHGNNTACASATVALSAQMQQTSHLTLKPTSGHSFQNKQTVVLFLENKTQFVKIQPCCGIIQLL